MNAPVPSLSACAVVISFFPRRDLLDNVSLLARQVDAVVVVDNGSSGGALDTLNALESQVPCTIIRNGKNLGIAAALNLGFRFAVDRQYEWIVSFDQDSTVTEGFIEALIDGAKNASGAGIVCPKYMDRESMTEMVLPKTPSGEPLVVMTSGSLYHRSTFLKAGPFDERLYIDSVDSEHCLRIRSMGLHLIQCERAVLLHVLGRISSRRFMGRQFVATNHSAARRYYITRNWLFVLWRYHRDSAWVRFNLHQMSRELAGILVVEDQKAAKLLMMIRGVIDFACGKWGPQVPL